MDAREVMLLSAENNAWANHRLHGAVAALSPGEYQVERTGFFPSLRDTLAHILLVDLYYIDAINGGGRGLAIFDDEARFADFPKLRCAQRESDRRLIRAVETAAELAAPVCIERPECTQVEPLGAVLLHLFQHQIHHRGQAHAMLSGSAVAPPQLDEFYLSHELPLREAELRELGLRIR